MAKEKKKKHWIKIVAPREFRNKIIGETLKKGDLVGKTLKVSLSTITGDLKRQNVNLCFVIKDVKEDKIDTEFYKYYLSIAYLKRLVRKSKNKIDDSFIIETKDKIRVKIKPFMITRLKTSKNKLTLLRKNCRSILSSYLKQNDFDNFIQDVITFKIQGKLKYELKKIYPLSLCEIRCIEKVK